MTTMRALESIALREMPSNVPAEQAVIGAVLMNNEAFRRVSDILTDEHFREPLHRRIWIVISGLLQKGQPATPITCRTYLKNEPLDGTGLTPAQYLAHLAAEATTVANARDYAKVVRDLAIRRDIIGICDAISSEAYDAPVETTADGLLTEFESHMAAIRPSIQDRKDFEGFGSVSARAVRTAEDAFKRGRSLVGLSTGLPRLDEAVGGLQPSDLIIVAGRPGMGKTALATNVAFAVAQRLHQDRQDGHRTGVVGFSSLEMSGEQLSARILAEQARVPAWKIRRGIASADDMERYVLAQRELNQLPLLIDPTGGLNIGQLRMRARSLKKRQGLELLVIDYLQLMVGTDKRHNRVEQVTEITTGLKQLAKELEVPIVALAQLSREVERRDDRRPMLSDLRESGSIEQDADVVLFVYREEYYLRKQEPRDAESKLEWEKNIRRADGVAEIIIGKNRHGPEGVVTLGFEPSVTRFTNEPAEREPEPDSEESRRKKMESIPKQASELYGILRSMTIQYGTATPEHLQRDRRLKPNARLIPVDDARKHFAEMVMGPEGGDEKKVETEFKSMFKKLRDAGIARYTGDKESGWFVWIPGLVE